MAHSLDKINEGIPEFLRQFSCCRNVVVMFDGRVVSRGHCLRSQCLFHVKYSLGHRAFV